VGCVVAASSVSNIAGSVVCVYEVLAGSCGMLTVGNLPVEACVLEPE
jgi:hypothetical protein